MYPAKAKYRSEEHAAFYATSRFKQRVADRELSMVRDLLSSCGAVRQVLDSPCGTGRISQGLEGLSVVGCDVSGEMLRHASDSAEVLPVRGDIERLPFKDGAFDVVLSIRFLHHLTSQDLLEGCLKELARVSSGYVLVSYFRTLALQHLRRKLRFWRAPSHRQARSWRSFRAAALSAGLEPVASRCSAPFVSEQWFVLFRKIRP